MLRKLEFDFCLTGEMEQCSGMLFLRTTFSIIIIKLFFVWNCLASLACYYITQQLFQHSSCLLLLLLHCTNMKFLVSKECPIWSVISFTVMFMLITNRKEYSAKCRQFPAFWSSFKSSYLKNKNFNLNYSMMAFV